MTLIRSHPDTSRHLIWQADEELDRGDYLQASEKAWGAAVHAVKSVAERRGWEHNNITHLFIAARRIAEETGDNHIDTLFGLAYSLHINSKEGWMDDGTVVDNVADVKLLLGKLEEGLLKQI